MLLTLAIVGVYFYYPKFLDASPQNHEVVAYGESRIKFNVSGREIEAVSFNEISDPKKCLASEAFNICTDKSTCFQTSFHCKDDISEKYKKMLNKAPAKLHYVHFEGKKEPHNAIIMMWGLTKKESKQACAYHLNKHAKAKAESHNVSCI